MKVKKWLLGLITFAAMAVICAVCAGAETYRDFEYSVFDDGTVTITNYNGSAEKVDIPEMIDGKSVTEIGWSAFKDCESLKNVTIPDSVTSIGDSAFAWCKNLTIIIIPNSVTSIGGSAFRGCTSLKSIAIPNSVTDIGGGAFSGCTSLKSIAIPNSVTDIGGGAFSGCTSLTSVTIPNSVTEIVNGTFRGCTSLTSITIPNNVTSISGGAFENCTSLTAINVASENSNYVSVNGVLYNKDKTTIICYPAGKKDNNYKIPDSVTSIGSSAFYGCISLTSITIPDGVTSISNGAFSGCTSLTSITIPDSVTNIGGSAFRGCTSLTSITIPDSVTEIGDSAFVYCRSLTSVTIPNSVTEIGDSAFEYCSNLTSITIPNSVTEIDYRTFGDCTSLTSITIPNSVTEIGDSAFVYCRSLTSVTIPNSVTEIGENAFYSCKSLKSVTMQNGVKSIGNDAFSYCISLTSVTIPNSVTNIYYSAFEVCTSLTAINVATGNQNYVSVNGVLYSKNKTELICYPAGKKDKSYSILDSVTEIGDSAFSGCTSLTSITIPDSVKIIGYSAFSGCTSLTSIMIPDSVTTIGRYAFSGCTSFTAINVAAENQNYVSVDGVLYDKDKSAIICYPANNKDKSYKILDGVTRIGECAFSGCISLTDLIIPDDVMYISRAAFGDCISLKSITIPDSVMSIGEWAFSGCTSLKSVTIQGSVTYIGGSAFQGCTSLTAINVVTGNQNYASVNGVLYNKDKTELIFYPAGKKDKSYSIPDSVTRVNDLQNCKNLISVSIPGSVSYISRYAFSDCSSLAEINVAVENSNYISVNGILYNDEKTDIICYPAGKKDKNYTIIDGVTSIGGNFENCINLTSVTIPNSVTNIYYGAFEGCTSLTAINVATGNKNYVSVNGVLYNKDKTKPICYPAGKKDKNYKIPDGVTEIGDNAFRDCTSLTSITIPDSVTQIENYAFSGCISLTNVTIPDSVTYISDIALGYYFDNGYKKIDNFKIYCHSGTAAERYAINNDLDYVLLDKLPVLAKITGVKFGGRAADALRINWTKNTSADGYIVEMYQGNKWVRVGKITNNSTTTFRKAGLKAGTAYKFRVKAYKMYDRTAAYGAYSATIAARTNPSVMSGAKLGGRAADALRINWTKNTSADGYIVEMYQGNKWVRVAKITNNSTTTFRKAGLKASSVYKFRVRAYKMSGKTAVYSDYSAIVAARTNPSVIKGAKLGGRAADALRINWSKNASADGYIVEMYQGNKRVRVAKITNNSTTTFRKAGLKASTVYKFRVRAYKMSGKTALYGNYSATVTARTNPSIVKGVKIGGKAKDALRVNWTKNTSAQGYIVEMYKGGKWVRVAKITNNSTTTFRKAGLAKNTTYKFRVRAYHMSGKTALYGNYGSVSGKTAAK